MLFPEHADSTKFLISTNCQRLPDRADEGSIENLLALMAVLTAENVLGVIGAETWDTGVIIGAGIGKNSVIGAETWDTGVICDVNWALAQSPLEAEIAPPIPKKLASPTFHHQHRQLEVILPMP